MQCSLAINTEMLAIPGPDHGMDLELPLYDMLLPNEATELPIHQMPEQVQAPTEVGGLLELLPGKELQYAMS